jgi:hypothetical protein
MAERGHLDAQNPWPWLDPFTESASSFFNGRDDDVQALQRSLLTTPVCVFFGKSGLGKTSLLLAGLFPLLRERCLLPVPLRRVEHGAGTPALSSQLLRSLNDAVVQARLRSNTVDNSDTAAGDDVAALWERLHDRRQHLFDTTGRRWTIVFVLDQFEEIFTLQPDEHLRRQTFEQLGDLLENRVPPQVTARLDQHDELLDHLDLDGQPYRFLIALREDFLPELETWTDLIPRLGPNRYRLLPMSREQALDAVQKTGGKLVDAPLGTAHRRVPGLPDGPIQCHAGGARIASNRTGAAEPGVRESQRRPPGETAARPAARCQRPRGTGRADPRPLLQPGLCRPARCAANFGSKLDRGQPDHHRRYAQTLSYVHREMADRAVTGIHAFCRAFVNGK